MKGRSKRLLSLLLVFCMLFSMMPVSVFATDTGADENTTVETEQVTQLVLGDEGDQSGEGWTWDASGSTLTLSGANLTNTVITLPESPIIEVVSGTKNIIEVVDNVPITASGNLYIRGDGKLTINSLSSDPETIAPQHTISGVESITVYETSLVTYGYAGLAARDVDITNANVNIVGYGYGIYYSGVSGSTSVDLNCVSGSIVGERDCGIDLYMESNADNSAEEKDKAEVNIANCQDLVISGEPEQTKYSSNGHRSAIRVFTKDAETDAYVGIVNSAVELNGSGGGIFANCHSDNSASDDAAFAMVTIDNSDVTISTITDTWAAIFVNNNGTGANAHASVNIGDSKVKALCPNDVAIMTSTKDAVSLVRVYDSTVEMSGAYAGIRAKAISSDKAEATVSNSVLVVTDGIAENYNVIDEMDNGTSSDGTSGVTDSTVIVPVGDTEITANEDGTWTVSAGGIISVNGEEIVCEEDTAINADGTVDAGSKELIINNVDDLLAFAAAVNAGDNFAGKVVKLGTSIDLQGIEWSPIGGEDVYFAGEFDGQHNFIYNLTQTKGSRMGLFGLVEKAYIHDLYLKDISFTVNEDNARVGALAGNLQYWNVIEYVVIDGVNITVNGNDGLIGSVAGYVWKSQLNNVDVYNADFTVNGTGNVIGGHTAYGRGHVWDAGVTGNNKHWLDDTVQIMDNTDDGVDNPVEYVLQNYWRCCDVYGVTIKLNGTGSEAGGFFGSDTYNSHSNYFENCHVTELDVQCAQGTSQTVGGFIAWNNGTTAAGTVRGFEDCSVSGTITGADGIYGGFVGQVGGRACSYDGASADVDITCTGVAGGFVGCTNQYYTHAYTFTDCEATGDVSGTVAGGFAGKNGLGGDGDNLNVTYTDCTASGAVSGTEIAGGFLGEVNTELPATNWSTVEGAGSLTLVGNTASTSVTVSEGGHNGALIGYMDCVANVDAKEGNTVKVTLVGNTPNTGYNASEDTVVNDIQILEFVAQNTTTGVEYYDLHKALTECGEGETVELLTDVDLAGVTWVPVGGWDGSTQFLGEFDGNGKTISNLTIDDTNVESAKYRLGLFADLGANSSVHDLTIEKASITSTHGGNVGVLAGRSGASLTNITVDGVTATAGDNAYVGGVIGITNYYDAGDYGFAWDNVDATDVTITFNNPSKNSYGGGLLGGMNPNGARLNTYENCDVTNVTITVTGNGWHGGMWGWHGRSGAFDYVKNCTVTNVNITANTATNASENRVGGICGFVGVSGGLMENVSVNGGKLVANVGYAGGFTPWSYSWGQDTYKNCTVTNVDVTCTNGVAAGFVGASGAGNQNTKCIDCAVVGGTVTGKQASGFAGIDRVGNAGGAYILDGCSSSATVVGSEYAAGLIAKASSSYPTCVTNSKFTGNVSGDGYVCQGVITTNTDENLITVDGAPVLWVNVKDEEGKPTETTKEYVVIMNTVGYDSLAEAVAAANAVENGTVTLLQDVTVGETLNITSNVTINGNGNSITYAEGFIGTLFNVAEGGALTTLNVVIDGQNPWTFYNDTTTVVDGQPWYTRFVQVADINKGRVNSNVITNAGALTLGEGTVIQNITIGSDGENGKTENTETGYILKYNDDLAVIKSTGGIVTMNGAKITGNAGMILNAVNAETTITDTTIDGNFGTGNKGGVIIADGGTMEINNGSISGNKAMARSATILGVVNGSTVTYDGCKMENNKQIGVGGNTAGAMIVVETSGSFVMNGGSISNNIGGRAGAIASRWVGGNYGPDRGIYLNAGTISGNTTTNDSWQGASIFLRNSATIGEGMKIDGDIVVNASPAKLDITGGEINGSLTVADGLTATITGGTFNKDVGEWLAAGYDLVPGEDGTYTIQEAPENTWVIDTVGELWAFARIARQITDEGGSPFQGETVVLNADLDLNWAEWYPITFYGTFEGGNHTIKNITYIPTENGRMGFFQSLGGPAKNLTLENIKGTVGADGRFGGFARYLNAAAENCHVKNVEVTSTSTSAWIGGFTTYTAGGKTTDCSVTNLTVDATAGADLIAGFISLTSNRQTYTNSDVTGFKVIVADTDSSGCGVGGFVGQTQTGWNNPDFFDCDVAGIDVTASGLVDVGGFIAWPGAHTDATRCTTQGKIDVTGVTDEDCFAGGFFGNLGWNCDLGYMGHVVTDCTADVDIITKVAPAGGFVGSATNSNNQSMYATFVSCSASGDVTCVEGGTAPVGGFAGDADRGVYTDCSASGTVTGQTYAGGFVGRILDVNMKYDGRYPAGTRPYLADEITVEGCDSTSKVTGAEGKTAGMVGYIEDGTDVTLKGNTYATEPEYYPEAAEITSILAELTFKVNGEEKSVVYNGADGQTLQDLIGTNDYADFGDTSAQWLLAHAANAASGVDELTDVVLTLYADLDEPLVLPNKYYQVAVDYDITIDLNGFELANTTSKKTIETYVDTTIQNGTVSNGINSGRAVDTRADLDLVLTNVTLSADKTSAQALTIGGDVGEGNRASVTMTNSNISAMNGYGVIVYNPVDMNLTNSVVTAYGALYFKAANNSQGSAGSVVNATNSQLNSMNLYSGESNGFATVVFEDNNVTLNVTGGQLSALGGIMGADAKQSVLGLDVVGGTNTDDAVAVTGVKVNLSADTTIYYSENAGILSGNEKGNTVTMADEYAVILKNQSRYTKDNGDGTVTVISYVEWIQDELLAGRDVVLEQDIVVTTEYVESIPAKSNGNGKYNEAHGNGAVFNVVGEDVIFDLNGHKITYTGHDDYYCNKRNVSVFYVTDAGTLNIVDNSEAKTGAVDVYGMATAVYSVATDSKAIINGGTWTWYPCVEPTCGTTNIFMYASHGGELYINGGTFDNQANSEYMILEYGSTKETTDNGSGVDYDETKVEISGGTFIGTNPGAIKYLDVSGSQPETTVDGCADGFKAVDNGDGTYGVEPNMIVKLHLTDPTTGESATIPYLESNSVSEVVKTGKAFYADYYVMTLELQDNVVIDETIVIDYPMTIDLNSCTLTSADGINPAIRIVDGADVTVKNGSIDASRYAFILGASDGSSAGNLTIESGSYKGRITVASVTKGTLTVEGGEFAVTESQYGAAYLLNCIDANYKDGSAKIVVKGGTFHNFDPANNAAEGAGTNFVAEGYESTGTDNVWTVEQIKVAEINGVGYPSIQAAVDAAENGDTIIILDNITMDANDVVDLAAGKYKTLVNVSGKTVTIDLNGKKLYSEINADLGENGLVGFFATENYGHLTLTDSSKAGTGTVEVKATTTVYGLLVNFDATSTMVVEKGNYILDAASDSLIYSGSDETVTVKNGTFYLGNLGTGSNGSPWIFNVRGQNERNVIVEGGTYNADINHQYYPFEVDVPKELALKNNGDGTWTVVPAVAYVNEQEWSSAWYTHEVGYATLEEAVEAAGDVAKNGVEEVVTLLTNGQSATVSKEMTITKNGFTATITAGEGFEVTETEETYVVGVKVEEPAGTITTIGRTLSLDGVIYINMYACIEGFEGINIEERGGLLLWTSEVTEEDAVYANAETVKAGLIDARNSTYPTRYGQQTNGIAAKEYADIIYMRAYVQLDDGSYVYGPLDTFSVRQYCDTIIGRATSDAQLKETCIALLHFGAAAQINFNYNTEDLANKNIVDSYPSEEFDANLLTALDAVNTNITVSSSVTHPGKTLSLDGAIKINYYFETTLAEVVSAELLFWDGVSGELTADNYTSSVELQFVSGTRYGAQSREFAAKEYGDTIFACARFVDSDGNAHYSEVIAFSVEEYASRIISANTNQNLIDTVKKMVMYGEAAKTYFENK